MSLARLLTGQLVPPEIYRSRPMRGIDNSTADSAALTNDIFSYQKEIEFVARTSKLAKRRLGH